MKKSLGDILEDLFNGKKTGILNIAMVSEKSLFKFYFKNGEIYHISFGLKKGIESLKELLQKELYATNFISDITIDIKSKDIPHTEEIIKKIKNSNLYISLTNKNSSNSLHFKKIKEKLTLALIKQIGPIGNRVIEEIIQEKWNAQVSLSKDDLFNLVELLKDEIEDQEGKKEFQREAKSFIEEAFK